jgi:hypothetical protein
MSENFIRIASDLLLFNQPLTVRVARMVAGYIARSRLRGEDCKPIIRSLAPIKRLWDYPTAEECEAELGLIELRLYELEPIIDGWPENRPKEALQEWRDLHSARRHFTGCLCKHEGLVAA